MACIANFIHVKKSPIKNVLHLEFHDTSIGKRGRHLYSLKLRGKKDEKSFIERR